MGFYINKVRTLVWTIFYYLFSSLIFERIGKNCRFEGWIDIPQRGGRISLGDRVHICRRVIFSVLDGATLSFGDNVFIGSGVVISAHREVFVGNNCLIAEYVSIYDNDHIAIDIIKPISTQGYVTSSCLIQEGSWIGAGAKILRGAGLGRSCILGAGAVLKVVLPAETIGAGVPAKVVRQRFQVGASSDNRVPLV